MANQIVLVTGAGRGIGRAIATQLASQGHRIAVTARTESQLQVVADEITAAGSEPLVIAADLSDRAAPLHVIDRIEENWGPVEVLINNAGVGSSQNPKPLAEFDDDFWDLSFAVNVTAPYLLIKRVLPAMIEAGWGRIINIASINSKVPALHGAAYVASKHAIGGLTRAVAKDYPACGITCNAICPGTVATLMNDKRIEYDAQRTGRTPQDLEAEMTPLGRRMVPDEVAPLAVFLTGDGAGAINGQLINVCAGTVML